MIAETDLRYPIGKYEPQPYSEETKQRWLRDVQFFASDLEMAIQNMDAHQLDTPYREGGWSVKQLVHHMADSHMNAYIRFKLGLAEDNPTITPYEENDWAVMDDVFAVPINVSITLLHALHLRWHAVLKGITEEQFTRTIFHPQQNRAMTLWFLLGLYAWHGKHHVAHITSLKERNKW
jgi:uncharacterized damage-inducible protein DinB